MRIYGQQDCAVKFVILKRLSSKILLTFRQDFNKLRLDFPTRLLLHSILKRLHVFLLKIFYKLVSFIIFLSNVKVEKLRDMITYYSSIIYNSINSRQKTKTEMLATQFSTNYINSNLLRKSKFLVSSDLITLAHYGKLR